jgi:hypothetical protein
MGLRTRILARASVALAVAGASLFGVTGTASAAEVVQTFRNVYSGLCLDDSGDFGPRTFHCNGLNYQKWGVTVWGDGTRQLRNLATNRCLGARNQGSGGNGILVFGPCGPSRVMSWYVRRVTNGIWFESQEVHADCLIDAGGDYAGGNYIDITSCIGGVYPTDMAWQ